MDLVFIAISCMPCRNGRAMGSDSGLYKTFIIGSEDWGFIENVPDLRL